MNQPQLQLLYSRERIAQEVRRLGAQISQDFSADEVLLVAVLKGSLLFVADLARALNIPAAIDFVRLASYGAGMDSPGVVEFRYPLETSVYDRHVIIVEDIIDSGYTLNLLYHRLLLQQPRSLRVCTLIDKRARREVAIEADYVGITMDDGFIVGYGLDLDERYRHLPDIYQLGMPSPDPSGRSQT